MPQLSRKERDFLLREQLILDTAQNMIHELGYAHLTMDRVAEAVEYSKGTIYNHFSSKEDLVCSLCCRCMSSLLEMFNRAYRYEGSTRDRFSAIGIAYALYHQLHPLDAQNIQLVKTHGVREKLGVNRLEKLSSLEYEITQICVKLVKEAITSGDIPEHNNIEAATLVFGFWSLHYGGLLLAHSDISLEDLGFNPAINMLWRNAQSLMDAAGWQPLSNGNHNEALFNRLCSDLFPHEIGQLNG